MRIENAYVIYFNLDEHIKTKYDKENVLVFTELSEVKKVVREVLGDIIRYEQEIDIVYSVDVEGRIVTATDILSNEYLLEFFIETGGNCYLDDWQLIISHTTPKVTVK